MTRPTDARTRTTANDGDEQDNVCQECGDAMSAYLDAKSQYLKSQGPPMNERRVVVEPSPLDHYIANRLTELESDLSWYRGRLADEIKISTSLRELLVAIVGAGHDTVEMENALDDARKILNPEAK
jgi:hypothetical protein